MTMPGATAASVAGRCGESRRGSLEAMFAPRHIAVIGATERRGSVGHGLWSNLACGVYEGGVHAVNPSRQSIGTAHCWPSIAAVPERVDLAVIATPAATVPGIVAECREAGVRGALVLSAGFKESGPEGAERERRLLEAAGGKVRLLGPNCLGAMIPPLGLNATFTGMLARSGSVAFLSQSGALCSAILDWSWRQNVGFSGFVSVGSMVDVGWGDLIDHFGADPHTRSLLIYMESIGNARDFLSAARDVARRKPVIVLKPGRTAEARRAAFSHTGAMAGSDAVLDAAFRRAGVLRVESIEALFEMADLLGKQPLVRGPRLAIVTNAGGPAVLATDALVRAGGRLAVLSESSMAALGEVLPAAWSHANPVDILGDAGPERFASAAAVAVADPGCDGLLLILTPQAMSDPEGTARALVPFARTPGKAVMGCWMGGASLDAARGILVEAGMPMLEYPDIAARAFADLWRYSDQLRLLYENPGPAVVGPGSARKIAPVRARVEAMARAGRRVLTEVESKQVLEAYGLPTVPTKEAASADEAVERAAGFGYPVVLKVLSTTLTHKTAAGGVFLGLRDASAVRTAFRAMEATVRERGGSDSFGGVSVQPMVTHRGIELILGVADDPQLGPVLLFGSGGVWTEVYEDVALGLPPLNAMLARRMMERTKVYGALASSRAGMTVDLRRVEELLVRLSQMIVDLPLIRELDINPLHVSDRGCLVLDARILLGDPGPGSQRRLVIRPYPAGYSFQGQTRKGTPVLVRPIRPEDEALMAAFHRGLSEGSVRYRFFSPIPLSQRVGHERLSRACAIDYDREMALVAEARADAGRASALLGIARWIRRPGSGEAEFAIVVRDDCQRQGLGRLLLGRLLEVAREEGIQRMTGAILGDNHGMKALVRGLGFKLETMPDGSECRAWMDLAAPCAADAGRV